MVPLTELLFILILISFAYGLFSFRNSQRIRNSIQKTKEEHAIPEGNIIYSDLNKPAKPLFSKQHMLVGKPDYIVEHEKQYIPVEIKNTITNMPYKSHIMQLAAYCLLIEEKYNTKVPFGLLVYGNGEQYRIPFDNNLKFELKETMKQIRYQIKANTIKRNHDSLNKCRACSFFDSCDQKL